jgi:hypothetical protein
MKGAMNMQAKATLSNPEYARFPLSSVARAGTIGGIVALLICLIGIIQASAGRAVIYPFFSLGQHVVPAIQIPQHRKSSGTISSN